MTRFLPRILEDPRSGTYNSDTSRLFAYHQATKHTFDSVRSSAHFLDWKNQPSPFRTYEGASVVELARDPEFPHVGTFEAMRGLCEPAAASEDATNGPQPARPDLNLVSRLLWYSMAVSSWKKVPLTGSRYSLRVNPSSGNLHPTETYLAICDFQGVGDGLYHYRADRHALELRSRGAWTQRLARELSFEEFGAPSLIVGLTSIFWREAWKYRDRAYRYCCHDLGHAMMSILLAAEALGLHGGAVGQFGDLHLSRALGLIGSDEAPMLFFVFSSPQKHGEAVPYPEETFFGTANELSAEEAPCEVLLNMHRATILADTGQRPVIKNEDGGVSHVPVKPATDVPLRMVVRRRRSALDFDPLTPPMPSGELEQILEFATLGYRSDWRGNFSGVGNSPASAKDLVSLYLYVHRVSRCEPGVYYWDKASRSLQQLHRGDVKRVAAFLSLEQSLAENGCFTVSMIADLQLAAQCFGNRGYRYAYFEAGAIGQRLYLGAEALGWNATGIGAFYDDDVHRYLGFLEEKANTDSSKLPRQVIYHFAVGRAIPDPRIEA
jgi:SagB-type dehydrogenase family enzyme